MTEDVRQVLGLKLANRIRLQRWLLVEAGTERLAIRSRAAAQVSTLEVAARNEGSQSGLGSNPGGASLLGAARGEPAKVTGSHAR
jgi:hypothetical protein